MFASALYAMGGEMTLCANCNADLEGDLIYDTFLSRYGDEEKALEAAASYGATKTEGRWSRSIAIYDLGADRTVKYRCPDCGYEWERT